MDKVVVYTGSRNLYKDMAIAATRLVSRQIKPVDKIYFLIEDDDIGDLKVPKCVEFINVSDQKIFPIDSPNMRSRFTYLALIRSAYTKILPANVKRVLQLDVDTIVMGDLSYLWDIDLTDAYFAAVEEKLSNYKLFNKKYYNAGVMLINLEKTRKDLIDDQMIDYLNKGELPYIDQDAWNIFGVDKAIDLPVEYNETFVTGYTDHPYIVHYAGYKDWHGEDPRCPRLEHRYQAELEWSEKYSDVQ